MYFPGTFFLIVAGAIALNSLLTNVDCLLSAGECSARSLEKEAGISSVQESSGGVQLVSQFMERTSEFENSQPRFVPSDAERGLRACLHASVQGNRGAAWVGKCNTTIWHQQITLRAIALRQS